MRNKAIVNNPAKVHTPYKVVKAALSEQVSKGRWTKGSMIPGQRELAREFNVSVPTLQRAIADMVAEGVLRIEDRRGTFVAFGDTDEDVPAEIFYGEQVLRPVSQSTARTVVGVISMIHPNDAGYVANETVVPMVQELENSLFDLGFATRFYNRYCSDGTHRTILEVAKDALKEGVGAFALSLADPEELPRLASQIGAPDIPILCVEMQAHFANGYVVRTNNVNAGYQAASHLLAQGCKSLMFVSPRQTGWANDRIEGAKYALTVSGMDSKTLKVELFEGLSNASSLRWELSSALTDALFECGLPADGIIAANDRVAFSVMEAAAKRGFVAGIDYGIVGFDDTVASREKGLTTMHPPLTAMVKEGTALLAAAINGSTRASTILMRSRLIVRSSSTLKRH